MERATMHREQRMVADFHVKHGFVQAVTVETRFLRARLIVEEAAEFVEGAYLGDAVKMADGLADLAYVTLGTGVAFGAVLEYPVGLVVPHPVGDPLFPPDGDALLARFFATSEIIDASGRAAQACCLALHAHEDVAALEGLLKTICTVAAVLGIPLGPVFDEVHASNMSKGPLDQGSKDGKRVPGFFPADVAGVLARLTTPTAAAEGPRAQADGDPGHGLW